MSVIDYDKNIVDWDYKEGVWTPDYALPSIEFFVHVWQKAETVQDVIDTFWHAFKNDSRFKHIYGGDPVHYGGEGYRLFLSRENLLARVARWRRKGVPLKMIKKAKDKTQLNRLIAMASAA